MLERAKVAIKTIPLLGTAAVWCYRRLRPRSPPISEAHFQRDQLDGLDARQMSTAQIGNLLRYGNHSVRRYGPSEATGYQRIEFGATVFTGQRNPASRLAKVPIDFSGKKVLDIGCNAGGMLFPLQGLVKWGVGIDNDYKLINAANRIRYASDVGNLQYFVFDVEREPLDLVNDFLPEPKVDVIFLLAVCHWIENWREVISFCARLSNVLVFESNGPDGRQEQQIATLREHYRSVALLTDRSEDDPMFDRKMFLCTESKHVSSAR